MRSPLDKSLRKQLERAVEKARDIAELAAREELQRLAVGESSVPNYLTDLQRELRNRLRAHARQLGDTRRANGEQGITLLVTESAYQHWHRMLFSRFLAENNLLMYGDGVTPLAISDCFELAEEETGDSSNGWKYAADYAAKMLPQIFRTDSPVFELQFAPNHQKKLEQLLESLEGETFQAQDSLGWVYQFWQSKRKEEVNASEVKIGAKELSPVTQLFTEPYMVGFLLDNALGAWWASQQLTQADYANAQSEDELREKVSIKGVPLNYLRFIKTYTTEQQRLLDSNEAPADRPEPQGPWEPAAGSFEGWPDHLSELKTLDPCCGSGHFLVAVLLMLVPLRMRQERLDEQEAIDAVLQENIYGLELDQRCVEIAVFALALEAWRYPNSGGYRQLPELNLACSGLSVKAAKDEWEQLGLGKKNLSIALGWMHKEFSDAPVLGSLINPVKSSAANIVSWKELSGTLNEALEQESEKNHQSENEQKNLEATVVAQGMAKAATMLAGKYQWVVTNVPYLARGKQDKVLQDFIEQNHPAGKSDLATAFLDRCLELCVDGGSSSVVLPQNWLFLSSYKKFREKLLTQETWKLVARLGAKGFQTPMWDFNVQLITLTHGNTDADSASANSLRGVDVSNAKSATEKAEKLWGCEVKSVDQKKQLDNPDYIVALDDINSGNLLSNLVSYSNGIQAGDSSRFVANFWEFFREHGWSLIQVPSRSGSEFGGLSSVLNWDSGRGEFWAYVTDRLGEGGQKAWVRGVEYLGSAAIAISATGKINSNLSGGGFWNDSVLMLIPHKESDFLPIYCYCKSPDFERDVRKIDQKLNVRSAVTKVSFDSSKWQAAARIEYPNGLPLPYTNEPSQYSFHGHPCGSVIWDERNKRTIKSNFRVDETVLQVAVARLIGYRWPAELDLEMELAVEQREWIEETKKLLPFVDDDGVVCLPAVRGEKSAGQRLEGLLQAAYGDAWSTQIRNQLLESVGCKNKGLDVWLHEKFFEQHCKLFQHRPFIWHIWDGLKDGFSALVNYHQLDKKNLERLIYTYLDDWIRTQTHQQSEGIDGASERLTAAQHLKQRLELILEGEKSCDIFVRWKPLEQQSIGWNPDLNDGVRLNIRPFMSVDDVGKKGAGILRAKPNIHWKKDRGKDVESAPWYSLGLEYGGKEGDRINEHHLTLAEKQAARDAKG